MAEADREAGEHLEQARTMIWDAVQLLEDAQRVLFKAGDRYVAQVWGDGVRAVLDVTERMSDLCGELTSVQSEVVRIGRRDRGRSTGG
ncbi:MAG TPA: hypothetical protein VFQ45_17530 [Longimicrobium sp.]|nr:hypothetical protein [Longimicrobium sp.]